MDTIEVDYNGVTLELTGEHFAADYENDYIGEFHISKVCINFEDITEILTWEQREELEKLAIDKL